MPLRYLFSDGRKFVISAWVIPSGLFGSNKGAPTRTLLHHFVKSLWPMPICSSILTAGVFTGDGKGSRNPLTDKSDNCTHDRIASVDQIRGDDVNDTKNHRAENPNQLVDHTFRT